MEGWVELRDTHRFQAKISMQLTLAEFPVRQIRLGSVSGYHDELLEVDREDLTRLVRQDARIESAQLDVVSPGEPVRVTGIRDVIEPRVKFDNDAQVFPGVIGPVVTVGDGVTHRLSGMAVLAAAAYEGTIRAGTGVQRSAILDMWGAGAAASRFSGLRHLVLSLEIRAGLGELEAHQAIQHAAYQVACKLAETTQGLGRGARGDFLNAGASQLAATGGVDSRLHHPSAAAPCRRELLWPADPRVVADGTQPQ